MKEKAQMFITQLKNKYDYPINGNDTLIDLKGDNFKDILVEYYGLAWTRLKTGSQFTYMIMQRIISAVQIIEFFSQSNLLPDKRIVAGYYIEVVVDIEQSSNGME